MIENRYSYVSSTGMYNVYGGNSASFFFNSNDIQHNMWTVELIPFNS